MPTINIRKIDAEDYPLLEEFLYLAVYQRDPEQPVPRSVIDDPRVRIYIEDFGSRPDDSGLVAEIEGKVVGAAWARVLGGDPPGYGYIDETTPELAISLLPEYRRKGIGTRLMRSLLGLLAESGYARTSLSVDGANFAAGLYAKLGFVVVAENDEDLLMVRDLSRADQQSI